MDAFYSAFHAWATTATESDVLAILESDEDVEAMYSDVFDPQYAMSGTAHDPCGAEFESSAAAGIARFRTLGTVLAAAATLTM
jgi:hypothetical protein